MILPSQSKAEVSNKTQFSCQQYWEQLLNYTPQELHLLRSIRKAELNPDDLLVLASRLANDPDYVKRFKKNIYGFLFPGKFSFTSKTTKP